MGVTYWPALHRHLLKHDRDGRRRAVPMKALPKSRSQLTAAVVLGLAALTLVPRLFRQRQVDDELLQAVGRAGGRGSASFTRPTRPTLIPRVIHQTYKTSDFTKKQLEVLGSWKLKNPTWSIKFYDDADCSVFVAREFPQWLEAYKALPVAVERADFFRYMVILRHGGVYADIDTECGRALDDFILPDDSFVAGWEDEYATPELAVAMNFARQRQMEQWVFAAAAGHPLLQTLCELVASMAFDPVRDHRIDALFRTGPAPFTDVVLRHAFRHPLRPGGGPHRVRVLPRVAFGGLPAGGGGLPAWAEPARAVRHLSAGSWKSLDFDRRWVHSELERRRTLSLLRAPSRAELGWRLFPVSTVAGPPFTVMTHLIGQGDEQAGADVAAEITKWGAPLAPGGFLMQRQPAESFMEAWEADDEAGKVLLDIGSGLGFYSLSAAARGRAAEAFELAPKSVASLQASIEYNGFGNLVTIHKVALGMWDEEICIAGFATRPSVQALRGYAKVRPQPAPRECLFTASRRIPAALGLGRLDAGAIRISASGWESWIIGGLKDTLLQPTTRLLLLELYPDLLAASGFRLGWESLVDQLQVWGFSNVTHVGHVCMRLKLASRWPSAPWQSLLALLSRRYRERAEQRLAVAPDFRWCAYDARRFRRAIRALPHEGAPELLLLRK